MLSTEERIAIDGLLIEREAAHARVSGIEAQIESLLQGSKYPYPEPETIPPSLTKRKATKAKKSPVSKKSPSLKIRRLKESEVAYRYTWDESGETKEAKSIDARLVENFLKTPPDGVRIQSIHTIDLHGTTQELLFEQARITTQEKES